jgi:hypothetical protein
MRVKLPLNGLGYACKFWVYVVDFVAAKPLLSHMDKQRYSWAR